MAAASASTAAAAVESMASCFCIDRLRFVDDSRGCVISGREGAGEEPVFQAIGEGDEACRLSDQKCNDQGAEDDPLTHLEDAGIEDVAEKRPADARQDQREDNDEGRAEEGAADAGE